MTRPPAIRARSGSSLITTLLVVVVLTIIVTAFLQSMTLERQTARSYLNRYRAQLAAEAGANTAINLLKDLIEKNPDSVTSWDVNVSPDASHLLPTTTLYYFDPSPLTGAGTTPTLKFQPLVSGLDGGAITPGTPPPPPKLSAGNLVGPSSAQKWVNLNSEQLGFGEGPWVGEFPKDSPSQTANPDSRIEAPWVEIAIDDPEHPGQKKLVGRYAYWVEDESFRVNVNTSGSSPRGSGTLGETPAEIPLQGVARTADAAIDKDNYATQLVTTRGDLGDNFPTLPTINQALAIQPSAYQKTGFLLSTASRGSTLSRTGARRVNINKLFDGNFDAIGSEIGTFVAILRSQAPEFTKRFFANAPGNDIYLAKLAANIRDYIDKDSQPTIVLPDLEIQPRTKPEFALNHDGGGTNEVWAIGKENVPRLQETALRVKQSPGMTGKNTSNSPWEIKISTYLEFWNMGVEDIEVSSLDSQNGANDAFVKILNQPAWRDVGGSKETLIEVDQSRDIEIPLRDFRDAAGSPLSVFKAGEVTVLTTDPNPESLVGAGRDAWLTSTGLSKIYRADREQVYSDLTTGKTLKKNNAAFYGGFPTIELVTRQKEPTGPEQPAADTETEIILGNGAGLIESHPMALPINPGIYVDAFGSKSDNQYFHLRGGALLGNKSVVHGGSSGPATFIKGPPYQFGDPRSNNEPLEPAPANTVSGKMAQFASWRSPASQSDHDRQHNSSLGLPNTPYINPAATGADAWPEATSTLLQPLAAGGSPAYVRNGPLRSIGELGHIYDPRRESDPAAAGGGRSLRIGQSEGTGTNPVWDGSATSPSRNITAWRLTDIFTTRDEEAVDIAGLVNPNGVLRDGGLALKAALEGFAFAGDPVDTDTKLAGKPLPASDIDLVVKQAVDRLTTGGLVPFLERGELSELLVFQNGVLAGATMASVNDRGREEIFRRLVELTTTRGSVFTVYAIGQALRQNPDGQTAVLSTVSRKVTFRLVPQFANPIAPINPSDPGSLAQRLEKPEKYNVEIISTNN